MSTLPRCAVAICLAAFGLFCCFEPDPIGRDIQSVKDLSVPPGGRLMPLDGPRREGQRVRATWEVETDMAWDAYAAWVTAQLPEFQVRANDAEGLRLSRPLEGDVYTLTVRRKAANERPLIDVTFEAQPF
jgi:hypothetical protein